MSNPDPNDVLAGQVLLGRSRDYQPIVVDDIILFANVPKPLATAMLKAVGIEYKFPELTTDPANNFPLKDASNEQVQGVNIASLDQNYFDIEIPNAKMESAKKALLGRTSD